LKASFGGFLSALFDLILMNLMWFFCSLPVLTIGPATSALFSTGLRLARGEQMNTPKEFISAFRQNFKQGLILGVIGLFAAAVIFSDGVYAFSVEGTPKIVFSVLTGVLTALLLTYFSYVFALQARFENALRQHIRNVYLLAFCAPGNTILMWLIYLLPAGLFFLLPQYVVAYVGIFYLILGMSLPVYLGCRVLNRVFARFMKDDEVDNDEEEDGSDEH